MACGPYASGDFSTVSSRRIVWATEYEWGPAEGTTRNAPLPDDVTQTTEDNMDRWHEHERPIGSRTFSLARPGAPHPRPPADCPACSRLANLWMTGEWACPHCGGPPAELAAQLSITYSTTR
jgi:hypothetical protein